MKAPLNIVVVYGDGSRVLRLCVPRWIAWAMLAGVAGVAAAAVGVSGEHALFWRERRLVSVLERRLDDQRALLDSFGTRVAAVRSEIAGWKALHAKMWRAFGPEAGAPQAEPGVGGVASEPPPIASGLPLGDELALLSSVVADEGPRLHELEHVVSRTGAVVRTLPLRWPVHGEVNSEYGVRRSPWNGRREQHDGIDIGSLPGTPVRAPAAGTVVAASSWGGYGTHVTLDHGNGVQSRYAHLRRLEVRVGQRVEKGQVVGLVGSTGRSTGPHLHYEVLVAGRAVDPRGFLWTR